MGKVFGTDGVRGKANDSLTPELAFELGRVAASVLTRHNKNKNAKIIIGKDTRISGDMLEAALAAGICSTGATAVLLGVIPTPGVAMLCRELKADAGAVISASHNPFGDNGIKFFAGTGYKLPDEVEDKIEGLLFNSGSIARPIDGHVGRIEYYHDAAGLYAQLLKEAQPVDLSGMKIVVDPSNGAASAIAGPLFSHMGAEVIAIFDRPDGCNINNACGSTHPEALMQEVIKQQAHIGIALDGDADRMIAVDEKGNLVDGDQILAICAADLQNKGRLTNNTLVATMMSNIGLTLAMTSLGIKVEETQVGDRYVLEKMQQISAVLGGEQSGHIIFADHNTTGDGLASALYLLSVMRQSGKPLSELAAIMQKLPQILYNVPVVKKDGWQEDIDIYSAYQKAQAELAGKGRVILRPSGTEQLLRVMVEGPDIEQLKSIINELVSVIQEKRGS
ncbi:MAG: phosphoglucosamine mutase [Bacillota bacterium]